MTDKMQPIFIPKEGVSDDGYKVLEIPFASGDAVKAGDILGHFETSKTAIEVEAPCAGFVHYNAVNNGDFVAVGSLLAVISDKDKMAAHVLAGYNESENETPSGSTANGNSRLSKPAQRLMDEHKIDASVFEGVGLVRSEDVYSYLNAQMADQQKKIKIPRNAKLVILGAGGHAKICIDIIRQMKRFKIVGLVDAKLDVGCEVLGVPVLGHDDILESLLKDGVKCAVIGVGALANPGLREKLYFKLSRMGFALPNIIHPAAIIEPSVSMGEGNQIMAGAIIGSEVRLGHNCIVNAGSILSHECELANNVHLTPGAVLAGSVTVGDNTIIGMAATVYLNVYIGRNVVIQNSVAVTKDVQDNSVVKETR